MKISSKLFLYLGLFYVPLIFIYGYFTHWKEPVGAVGLALSAAFGFMVATFLAVTDRKLELSPSDNEDGEISDVAGEYGFFSPHSWWPIALAAAISAAALGMAVGWWIVMVGTPILCVCVVGWTFEYFRGVDAI